MSDTPLTIRGFADALVFAVGMSDRFGRGHAAVLLDDAGLIIDLTAFTAEHHSIDTALDWANCLVLNDDRISRMVLISTGFRSTATRFGLWRSQLGPTHGIRVRRMDRVLEAIAVACARECERQEVGLDRLVGLLRAYLAASQAADALPSEVDARRLAGVIEPRLVATSDGEFASYRKTPATFPDGGAATSHNAVPDAMRRLFEALDRATDPGEFVRAFLSIHPFADGNGRTAFVLFNWLARSLDDPMPLPDYFGS